MLRRLVSLLLLLTCHPLFAALLKTNDGLALHLADDGQITALSLGGKDLPLKPGGGFYIADAGFVEPDNLLPNGDFEQPGALGEFRAGWRADSPLWTTTAGHTGKGAHLSLAAHPLTAAASPALRLAQPVAVAAGAQYRLSVWLKWQDLDPTHTPAVSLLFLTSDGKTRIATLNVPAQASTSDWVLLSQDFTPLAGEVKATVSCTLPGAKGSVWLDDLSLIEVGRGSASKYRRSLRAPTSIQAGNVSQKQQFADLGLAVQCDVASGGGYLSFSGKVQDLTGRDRAVEVGWEIPLQAIGWQWSDDILHRRVVEAGSIYRSVWECVAGPGYNQIYPFSSLAHDSQGLSLGVPLAQGPRVYSVEYDAIRQCLLIRFHFGLSPRVKKLPGTAWFSFLLCQHDGTWGLRAAADRYYKLFPDDFAKRVPYEGHLGYAQLETRDSQAGPQSFYGLTEFADFGRGFRCFWHQTAESGAEAADNLRAALQTWQRDNPRIEPYTWCVSSGSSSTGLQLDFQDENFARSDVPLTYDSATRKPAIADTSWEFNSQVLAPLSRQRQFLVLRTFVSDAPLVGADIPFMDVGLIECRPGGFGMGEESEYYARTCANQRVLRYWFEPAPGAVRRENIRQMFERSLPYAIYPHLLADCADDRDLYQQFIPVIQRLSAAGWEPITLARSSDPQVHVERYGRLAAATLAFAFRNTSNQPRKCRIMLDQALGLPTSPQQVEVRNLLTGRTVNVLADKGRLALPVDLPAGESAAYSVASTPAQLRADLLNAAVALREAAVLDTTEEMTYESSLPAEFLPGDTSASARPDRILADGWSTAQGLIWPAGEPLEIKMDLNAPHRLKLVRVHYGLSEGDAAPEAVLEACDKEGNWSPIGTIPAGAAEDSSTPYLMPKETGEYQLLRLRYPALIQKLWIKEIEIEGDDAALLRAAERFETLAPQASPANAAFVSQLAIALRVRRMLGHDRTLQERALDYLSDFCSVATGLVVEFETLGQLLADTSTEVQLVAVNRGSLPIREASVKLKLPPGWSASPGKVDLEIPPGQTLRTPITIVPAAGATRLTLLVTGMAGDAPIFWSAQQQFQAVPVLTAEVLTPELNTIPAPQELTVRVRSLAAEPLLATVALEQPAGWQTGQPAEVKVTATTPAVVHLTVQVPLGTAPGQHEARLLLRYGAHSVAIPCRLPIGR